MAASFWTLYFVLLIYIIYRHDLSIRHWYQSLITVALSFLFFLNYLFIYLFFYFWLCWVFVSVRGLSPVAASGGHSSSRCMGLSLLWPLLLQSTGSRRAGSVVVAHGPSCSEACGIFPDQGSNPCALHWQADSQPLRHQGSPCSFKFWKYFCSKFWNQVPTLFHLLICFLTLKFEILSDLQKNYKTNTKNTLQFPKC